MIFKSLLAAALAVQSNALTISRKEDVGYLSFPVNQGNEKLVKRSLIQGATQIDTPQSFYFTDLQVGFNKEVVSLIIDTGFESDTPIIISPQSQCTGGTGGDCHSYGTYDPYKSSSSRVIKNYEDYFTSTYIYNGTLVTDDVYFAGAKIPGLEILSVTNDSAWKAGLLGLARPYLLGTQDVGIHFRAKKAGLIEQAAYSIYLSTLDEQPGNLILGGIDYARVDGALHWSNATKLNVGAHVDSFEINGKNITVNRYYTADTGGAFFVLPQDQFNQFLDALPNDPKNPRGSGRISRSLVQGKTFQLKLNGIVHEIPLRAIIKPDDTSDSPPLSVIQGSSPQLGAFFFRYLYLAVNHEKEVFGWGKVNNSTSVSNIKPFPTTYQLGV